MHATFDRLGRQIGFDWLHRPSKQQMTTAVDMILAQRERALAVAEEFARQRIESKRQGRRQPTQAERRLMEESLAVERNHWMTTVGVPTA